MVIAKVEYIFCNSLCLLIIKMSVLVDARI